MDFINLKIGETKNFDMLVLNLLITIKVDNMRIILITLFSFCKNDLRAYHHHMDYYHMYYFMVVT